MADIKACIGVIGLLIAIMFPAHCHAQDLMWEAMEIRILEENGSHFSLVYFEETLDGQLGDPDLGEYQREAWALDGTHIRYHESNEVYLAAAGVFGDPRDERLTMRHDDGTGKSVNVPAYVVRVYANGCRSELDNDRVVRRYCHKSTIRVEAPSSPLQLARRNSYRYRHPITHRTPRKPYAV